MSVRREKRKSPNTGRQREYWIVDVDYRHPDGHRERVREVSPVQTKRGAEQRERQIRQALLDGTFRKERKEVPKLDDWFHGRFWREWVIARKNKPSEVEAKLSIYNTHLKERFGQLRLDEIDEGRIADCRASLVEQGLSEKRINNILAVVSKPLRYAVDVGIIERAPKVGMFRIDRGEILWWEFEHYARFLEAAVEEGLDWYVAACLGGEAGLRIGEIRALIWERDVDLIGQTITVNEQTRKGITGTPKGGTIRRVPMTPRLLDALKSLAVVRRGYVVRNPDGSAKRDGQTTHATYRICRKAGLPERGWHCLRHSYGTHSALFGVNPWRLMAWMGHKRITETLRYVHVAEAHGRPVPPELLQAARSAPDPDRRIIEMLSARGGITTTPNPLAERLGVL